MYDVNKNAILQISPDIYRHFRNGGHGNADVEEHISKLKEKGFLSAKRMSRIRHPAMDLLPEKLDTGIGMVTLQVTQQCNLRCEYCAYSGDYENRAHTNLVMSPDLARKSIDFVFAHSRDVDTVSIGFYGGEPLLAFDLVKECIAYAEESGEGKETLFTITTNGTLLDRDTVGFLAAHDVQLMISLDGPKFMHDKHRKYAYGNRGSFEKIMNNIEMVREHFPEYVGKIKLSVVLDPQNDFSCINEFFVNYESVKDLELFPALINDKYIKKRIDVSPAYVTDTKYELFKIFLSKLDRLDKNGTSRILGDYVSRIASDLWKKRKITRELADEGHHSGPCVPGVQRFFIDVNGRFFPCERVSEESDMMIIGNIEEGFFPEKIRSLLDIGRLTEDRCKNCWAFRYCNQCAADADELDRLSGEKKASRCANSRQAAENRFKDYCTLKEFGYDFEKS